MKLTIKLALVVCLFSSVAFADGEMGSGGKNCTSPCLVGNPPTEEEKNTTDSDDYILSIVKEYLISIFG